MISSAYDIIVVGGGHAGAEAAYMASQFKQLKVALISLQNIGIASAPCNPSIGGVGKGQVVREIDAMGGLMGKLADKAGIQFRVLNESKGHAVRSTRVQIDKDLYSSLAEKELMAIENLTIIRDKVASIKKNGDEFIISSECSTWNTKKIIVTLGTFLNGKLHTGKDISYGGRINAEASSCMDDIFKGIKTRPSRFKTGTPARIHKNSIDYTVLEEQPSDGEVMTFHAFHAPSQRFLTQKSCFLARTNKNTADIIKSDIVNSPMFNGQIEGVGARYCPSIEDKVFRYPEKTTHHVFIEPEGLNLDSMYPSGVSSSLPRGTQEKMLKTIKGLENCEILSYGYAVEYDVVDTTNLNDFLEHKDVEGLFFAGQVNGTSGYEEAAGQGLVAAIGAVKNLLGLDVPAFDRNSSYIGVMIEDLITNTRDEPYRLFTARSENRLYIREDNSILRMYSQRKSLNLAFAVDSYNKQFKTYFDIYGQMLDTVYLSSSDEFIKRNNIDVPRRTSLSEILKQAKLNCIDVLSEWFRFVGIKCDTRLVATLAISKKYEGYILKSQGQYQRLSRLDTMKISWQALVESENISFECKQRIKRIRPATFAQLKNIEGLRPATLAAVAGIKL